KLVEGPPLAFLEGPALVHEPLREEPRPQQDRLRDLELEGEAADGLVLAACLGLSRALGVRAEQAPLEARACLPRGARRARRFAELLVSGLVARPPLGSHEVAGHQAGVIEIPATQCRHL